ncbi:MAG: VanW family protein [Candidatus Peregrinibacteria bacterium]
MPNSHKETLSILLASSAILLLSVAVPQSMLDDGTKDISPTLFPAFTLGGYTAEAAGPITQAEAALMRVAQRMSKRIAKNQGTSPPISRLTEALKQQRALLRNQTIVTLQLPDNPTYRTWEVNLQKYPTWLKADISPASAYFRVDEERIRQYLQREEIDGIVTPHKAVITAIETDEDVERVVTSTGAARPGIVFDMPTITHDLATALSNGTETLVAPLYHVGGPVENQTEIPLGELTLLGMGKSDFKGSTVGRIFNVRKAINEHVNNALVPPGATFSFNDTLGRPVTLSNGWREAKVIFNTNELRMAPGGGICQASTTTFRAMLNAGFPSVKRANHSMYVSYYEKYGVGIDATVFPGSQDLTFVNDTGNYLLFQAYTEGTEAVVQIYGSSDGRTSMITGPFFTQSDLVSFPQDERPPRGNEIAWIQRIVFADGREESRVIYSRYTSIPKTLAQKYQVLVHASAGQETM